MGANNDERERRLYRRESQAVKGEVRTCPKCRSKIGFMDERIQKMHVNACMGTKKPPRIIVVMEGGVIQNVVKKGTRIKVEIRDFDVEGTPDVDLKTTPKGEQYYQSIY